MKKLKTKHFSKWALKQKISEKELSDALAEVEAGNFEANLGGGIQKKNPVRRARQKRKRKNHHLLQKI